jgi:hypothetical protein
VAFEKSNSRSMAGDIVRGILGRFELYALTFGAIAWIFAVLEMLGSPGGGRTLTLKLALLTAMWALALYARFVVGREISGLREGAGDMDAMGPENPTRRAFARLHGLSVLCLLGQILLGALALGLSVMALLPHYSRATADNPPLIIRSFADPD